MTDIKNGLYDLATENLRIVGDMVHDIRHDAALGAGHKEYPPLFAMNEHEQKICYRWAGRILGGTKVITEEDKRSLRNMGIWKKEVEEGDK